METFLRLVGSLLSLYTTISTVSSSSAICRCCPVPSTSSTSFAMCTVWSRFCPCFNSAAYKRELLSRQAVRLELDRDR